LLSLAPVFLSFCYFLKLHVRSRQGNVFPSCRLVFYFRIPCGHEDNGKDLATSGRTSPGHVDISLFPFFPPFYFYFPVVQHTLGILGLCLSIVLGTQYCSLQIKYGYHPHSPCIRPGALAWKELVEKSYPEKYHAKRKKPAMISVYLFVICFRACNNTIHSDGLQNIQDQSIHCI
jgi:hypothetical protein